MPHQRPLLPIFNGGQVMVFFRNNWREIYEAIRNANSLLDNIDNVTILSADRIASLKGEALFLRSFNYVTLYDFFRTSSIGHHYRRAES